jgi:hypothetical protein
MQIVPVKDANTLQDFLSLPASIYKNDPNWIQPLDKDIEEVFDPKKNKAFRFGELERWILRDAQGKCIGRIAAFVNKKYKNKGDDIPVGGAGFFECINDQQAADALFDTAKAWLQHKGMEAMDGPVNFGERDRWWGLVIEGFQPPLYCMNYNPPYYVDLFKNYGFQLFFEQHCFFIAPKDPLNPKVMERHAMIAKNPDFSFSTIDKNKLEKFAIDFATVYNKAWAGHGGLKQMPKEQAIIMFKKMKPVMDEKLAYFVYHKSEPVACFINLPDLNQWFKHLHGKFGLLQKLKFLWVKQFTPNRKFTGLVFGVVPEWQGKGIDNYLIGEAHKVLQSQPYVESELQWIGDFNPKMINIARHLGDTSLSRRLATFRYLFDRNKEFVRHPML